jgi:phosphoribosylformylglycinamidine (FGAM) synthase PurS component
MTAKVYVTLKKAVLDPQGKAVERSLAQLGLRIGSLVRPGPVGQRELEDAMPS